MSKESDSQVPQNFCIECKSDLAKESHLKNCKNNLTAEQQTEILNKKLAQEQQDAELAAEKKKKDDEQAELLKKELEKEQEKETKLKQTLIEKILKIDPKANIKSLKLLSLESLKVFYKGVTETLDNETRKISKIKVKCPKCQKYLGITTSFKEIQSMQKDHRKECEKIPKGTSTAIKLILGLAILGLALGTVFVYQNPHLFKKKDSGCSDCEDKK